MKAEYVVVTIVVAAFGLCTLAYLDILDETSILFNNIITALMVTLLFVLAYIAGKDK